MALPGGILKCEICGMSCVNTIIYDRTCTDMTLYPQLICHVCQDKRKIIWDYLDRIKKKKMKECICFPPKKEPHDKCCTCIQDESRGWKDCPEHGHKYKDVPKVKNKFKATPHIYITKEKDYKGDYWYWYKYEVCDWTNSFHTYEGSADSKQDLFKRIGEEIARHLLEDGMLYGL